MASGKQLARLVCSARKWIQRRRKKGGEGVGYSGHKHQKGEKAIAITDNRGNILAPCVLAAVNVNDSKLWPESLNNLTETAERVGIDLFGSFLTLDSIFYGKLNHQVIEAAGMIPVIKPNHRNTKDKNVILQREEDFKEVRPIYGLRFPVEHTFAWEDKYRRLVIRYEKKQQIARGWKLMIAALVNFRECFGGET